MDLGFEGRVVIVTGGASNVGRAISEAFAQEGARVVIFDFDEEQMKKAADEMIAAGGDVTTFLLDVTDEEATRATIAKVESDVGPIAVLVNNVGWCPRREFFRDTDAGRWNRTFQMNLFSVFNMTHAVLPYMVERRGGSIVSISSDAAVLAYTLADYGAMKAAIVGFDRTIAQEYGRYGIRVNTVAPGTIVPKPEDIGKGSFWNPGGLEFSPDTLQKMAATLPLKKLPEASDVAYTVLFVASDKAKALTGQYVGVSSGSVMPR